MNLTHYALAILVLLAGGAGAAPLPATESEQAVAERLVQRQVPGEMLWLIAEGRQFPGLYLAPAGGAAHGAVILVHGFGGHPDWPEVVSPLRTGLPEHGWATLSIQLPRLSPEASHALESELTRRALPRLRAALAVLEEKQVSPVAVAGIGFGAAIAARHLGAALKGPRAFVAVSLQAPEHLTASAGFPESLELIPVPVLDIYAAQDSPLVRQQAPERELWGRKNKERVFDRIVIAEAPAGFHGKEAELSLQIARWLDQNATPAGINPAPQE